MITDGFSAQTDTELFIKELAKTKGDLYMVCIRSRNGPPGLVACPKENFMTGRVGLLFLLGRPVQCLTKAFSSPYIDIAIEWNNKCSV